MSFTNRYRFVSLPYFPFAILTFILFPSVPLPLTLSFLPHPFHTLPFIYIIFPSIIFLPFLSIFLPSFSFLSPPFLTFYFPSILSSICLPSSAFPPFPRLSFAFPLNTSILCVDCCYLYVLSG